MSYVITIVAPQASPFFADEPIRFLQDQGLKIDRIDFLARDRAVDIGASAPVPRAHMDQIRDKFHLDIFCQHRDTRAKKLFFADMDATMVVEETLDELAGYAGIKDQIAAITVRAMSGELDFHAALHERVGLLKGLPEKALFQTHERTTFSPGAQNLLSTLKSRGLYCVLVSGGFTYFTTKVAESLGFDEHHGNTLILEDGELTGTVGQPVLDKMFKQKCLFETAERMGIALTETVAIGDGANDLPMLQAAGFGVGWRSKQVLRDALDNHILFGGLDTLTYALGIHKP
ncbi:MAG TPA: phosphoserine phosphatase SerB [Alphaproteobacteria bacterium]